MLKRQKLPDPLLDCLLFEDHSEPSVKVYWVMEMSQDPYLPATNLWCELDLGLTDFAPRPPDSDSVVGSRVPEGRVPSGSAHGANVLVHFTILTHT